MAPKASKPLLGSGFTVTSVGTDRTDAYYQNSDNSIAVVWRSGDGNWQGGDNVTAVNAGKFKPNSPMAMIHWSPGAGKDEYRMYYLDSSNRVCQVMRSDPGDKGVWRDAVYVVPGATAAPNSQISAVVWYSGGNPHIRVFYQGTDNKLREQCWEPGGFKAGAVFAADALPGTAIAAVNCFPDSQAIRLYYQTTKKALNELWWDGSKYDQGEQVGGSEEMPDRAAICATVPTGAESKWVCIYHVTKDNKIKEYHWTDTVNPGFHPAIIPLKASAESVVVPNSKLGAISYMLKDSTEQPEIQLFVQQPTNIWTEWACKKGKWASKGLTGANIKMV